MVRNWHHLEFFIEKETLTADRLVHRRFHELKIILLDMHNLKRTIYQQACRLSIWLLRNDGQLNSQRRRIRIFHFMVPNCTRVTGRCCIPIAEWCPFCCEPDRYYTRQIILLPMLFLEYARTVRMNEMPRFFIIHKYDWFISQRTSQIQIRSKLF